MADQYRYFRIEARELADALTSGLTGLSGGAQTSGQVGLLLRNAHTLKGAARVVSAAMIADLAHAFEEVLEPYRHSGDPIPADALSMLQVIVDGISDQIRQLDASPTVPPQSRETAVSSFVAAGAIPVVGALAQEPRDETARVRLTEIDDVIDGVGQALTQVRTLLTCVAQLGDLRSRLGDPAGTRPSDRPQRVAGLEGVTENVQRTIGSCAERISRELREVHDVAQRLRLVPVDSIAHDLERAARDVATEQGKQVKIDLTGGQIRLDAPVLAAAQVALRQIVRNAVAHGIEPPHERLAAGKPPAGQLHLQISRAGSSLMFRCDDDGRGIDLHAVRRQLQLSGTLEEAGHSSDQRVLELLMEGGVSTATVLSEVSGRGIGLDVVRDAAQRLGGEVRISTTPGRGTTIELTAPGSLTAQQVLIVEAGHKVAVPLSAVRTTARVPMEQISRSVAGETLTHDGETLPFMPLASILGDTEPGDIEQSAWTVLILRSPACTAAVGVSRLLSTADIAIRPVPDPAPVSPMVSGVWLDLDGRPRLVLDPAVVVTIAAQHRGLDLTQRPEPAPILVIDDSLTTRMLEQSILQSAGYQVDLAASAEEGLWMAANRPYSLILVDVEMPGMDGFAFVEQTRARAELRHLPCILVTTRSSSEDRQRGIDAGARAHIDKGEFHQGRLLTLIAELLAEGQP